MQNRFLCSGIALYGLIADGEGGAEIYAAATKLDQAKKVWGVARDMVKRSEELSEVVRAYHNSLVFDETGSIFRPLASDSGTLDGLNPHVIVCDELHAWQDAHLWYVLKDGMGARSQPLMVAITTAGHSREGICYQQREHAINVLKHTGKYDDSYFGYIATIDKDDDWREPKVWRKANPLLGTAKKEDWMQEQATKAEKIASQTNEFKNTQLNIWTQIAERWLNTDVWVELADARILEDFKGEKCIAGVDLASTTDLTAIAYVFEEGAGYFVWPVFFLPEESIENRKVRVPYQQWADEGWLETTLGSAVDQSAIRENLNRMNEFFDVEEIAIDPWNSAGLTPQLIDDGFNVVNVRQGFASLSAPSKELEKLIVKRTIKHNGNPVLTWNVGNVVADQDPAGNIKPNKDKSADKIDGVAATINALARYLVREKPKPSVYERRAPRVIK